MKKEVANQMLL